MTARSREISGLALVAAGIAGCLLPLLPGIPLIVAGAAILGTDHALVRRSRSWLEKKKILKPQA
jgi:uncharacterized membrane protein YbaN (DUF454 family)